MVFFIFCLATLLLIFAFKNRYHQLTPLERFTTMLFAGFLSLWVDVVLGLMYDKYFYFHKGAEWSDFIFHFGMYPAISWLYLNAFPFKHNLLSKIIYFLGWSAIAYGYEQFFVFIKVFHYQNYNHLWSLVAYPALFIILLLNLSFVRWLGKKAKSQ